MQFNARGKVPHFSMRPHPVVSFALILVLVVGLLISMSLFYKEDGTGTFKQQGVFVLIITAILTFCLSIMATSKWWHPHLWKRNSTHARHHEHTRHHPTIREKEFRNRR